MVSKEEAIAELAKLLANGAISAEVFTMSVSALNNAGSSSDSESNQPPKEKTRDEKIYETVMEYVRNLAIAPSTAKYPPFSECEKDNMFKYSNTWWFNQNISNDKESGESLLTCWHTYIDSQNSFGAMLRKYMDFVFDNNNNLICIYIDEDDKLEFLPLYIVNNYQKTEDCIEAELYEKYMSGFTNSGTYKGWSYPPYNSKMLITENVSAIACPAVLFFSAEYVDIKVTYLKTWLVSGDKVRMVFVIVDGVDTFNLIRGVIIDSSSSLTFKFDKSDASKN